MKVEAIRVNSFAELDGDRMSYFLEVLKPCGHGIWWLYLPGCGLGNLSNHQVTEHEDRTITVMPSIQVTGHNGHGTPVIRHGYLTRGVWEEC